MHNFSNIQELIQRAYVVQVIKTFGDDGRHAMERLLDGIIQIYSFCAPDLLAHPLTVCSPLKATPNEPLVSSLGESTNCADAKAAAQLVLEISSNNECIVEICRDGTFRVLKIEVDKFCDDSFMQSSVLYRFENATERIRFKGYDEFVPKVHPAFRSSFARPTYSGLEDAFKQYATIAADAQCRILAEVWEGGVDGHRLVMVNKPEEIMRNSLAQALSFLLGGEASVKTEQNVDDTKPVDIRVEWHGSDSSALVEIKWMGRAIAKPTTPGGAPYRDYGPGRAQDGSKQLADYLDRNLKSEKRIRPLGYHVVFDARRLNINGPADALSKQDGFHFKDKDVTYNPDHSSLRSDFRPYVRFFLKPLESQLVAA